MSGRPILADVLQHGAREHYAVPRMLHHGGLLRQLYTDVYAGAGSILGPVRSLRGLANRIPTLARLLGRTSDLPAGKVSAFNAVGLTHESRIRRITDSMERAHAFRAFNDALCEQTLKHMKTPPDAIVAFRGCQNLFQQIPQSTCRILDQMDGGIHEVEVMKDEQRECLDWLEGTPDWLTAERQSQPFWMDSEGPHLRAEWKSADRIVCNSEWSVRCLNAVGIPREKCCVIPLAFNRPGTSTQRPERTIDQKGRLRVGFLGTLTTRKGIQHLLPAAQEAAKHCDVKVVAAGGLKISAAKIDQYSDVMDFRGRIPRDSVEAFFREIDVLALPSISDGFGIVQLEAMSRGIPVIASDQTGDVVRNGKDGFRVRAGVRHEITEAIVRMATDVVTYNECSANAVARCDDFSLEKVSHLWCSMIQREVDQQQSSVAA